ncbi:hypothetical protein ANANG_G00300750 [Anguilla anguilla]|uniref:Serologically defined colon cancer antigen 8 n=1 Tax=Anguilla anguilla TaxID=7936 RepID=A0A9D3RIA9_ANGAN|nr:hypothetical protein ANANG_G00300750 [Anguilla anguilla]
MKPSIFDSDEEDFREYQQELRERANRSIQRLSRILNEQCSEAQSMEPAMSQDSAVAGDTWNQQSDAVNQLRSLLQEQDGSPASSPAKRRSLHKSSSQGAEAGLPTAQDLVPMIHNQAEYIQHLEAEVKFCKEELLGMKQRIRVVIVENEKLHKELKSYTGEETLKDYTILDATNGPGAEPVAGSHPRTSPFRRSQSQSRVQAEDHTWQNEMDKLKTLYQAQTETLEAQVISLRKDLAVSQKECEEVKGRLRTREAAAASGRAQQAGGLCLKCAQHEAILTHTHTNVHVQAIERLTRERDELAGMLASLRASQSDAQHREWSSYQQVKQAVQMAEEANLEKTEALVQCEQIRSELIRQRERLERELVAEQEKISQTVAELCVWAEGQVCSEGELQLAEPRGRHSWSSLQAQLEEALRKLSSQEAESNKVCGELRYQLSHAQLKRQEAERELRDHTSKSSRQLELTQQEVEKLGLELIGCRQRLDEAQQDGGRAQAEVLSLTERLCHAQHQLHLTRQEKEATERAAARTRTL